MHILFGGSFDPVHEGHLRTAEALRQRLGTTEIFLLPAARSPLKQHSTPDQHRLAMLQLALRDYPSLKIDDRELRRPPPSFTIDTLRELRLELGAAEPIVWVIGADALEYLSQWKDWQQLTSLAHLLVVERPGGRWPEQGPVADWLAGFTAPCTTDAELNQLQCAPGGKLARINLTPMPVSSTAIRNALAARMPGTAKPDGLPDSVWHYIIEHSLYQV
ncbi:MAG TPA: nicotinate-nucleotide adenylyltransferase [Pseudomonadales bacterium]|nr:nicotinate-nucleotide adenylyltransferase [Pseudomonadales bacterium]